MYGRCCSESNAASLWGRKVIESHRVKTPRWTVDCSAFNNENAITSNHGVSGNFVALLTGSFCILVGVVVFFSEHKINGILC